MEEKILAKLESLENNIDKKLDQKLNKLKNELREELKEEFNQKFEQLGTELEEKLSNKFEQRNIELEERLTSKLEQRLEKKILDHMFVFEDEYGKKLTVAFEDLTCRHATEETNSEQIANLEKRCELNTAYIYGHEDRIKRLEKIH